MPGPLRRLYNRILAESESDTQDDGYLSWQGEWHAAAWGFAVAFLAGFTGNPEYLIAGLGWIFTSAADGNFPGFVPYPRQIMKESLYAIAHAVVGFLVGGIAAGLVV